MNKSELIAEIAEKTNCSKVDTERFVNTFIETIKDTLLSGEKVTIYGHGTYEVVERSQRIGRNPSTGEEIKIPACKVPHFKASPAMKTAFN